MKPEVKNNFTVERISRETISASDEMRRQSWLDTYVNEDQGVTREWVEEQLKEKMSPDAKESRMKRLNDPGTQGWVALDNNRNVIGATWPFIDQHGVQRVGSLYVDKKWHGKGVGPSLMQKVIDFLDPKKAIELEVASYNDRAITFYQKWGFEKVPDSDALHREKMPIIKMVRKGEKS